MCVQVLLSLWRREGNTLFGSIMVKPLSPGAPSLWFDRTYSLVLSLSLPCSFPEPGGAPGQKGSPRRAAAASLLPQTSSHRGEQGLGRTSHRPNRAAGRATSGLWTVTSVSLSFNKPFLRNLLSQHSVGLAAHPKHSSHVRACCHQHHLRRLSQVPVNQHGLLLHSFIAYCIHSCIKAAWKCFVIDNIVNCKGKILFQFNQQSRHCCVMCMLTFWGKNQLGGKK